jgi:hypothetical protein
VQKRAVPVVALQAPPPQKLEIQLFLGRNKEVVTFDETKGESKEGTKEEVVK